jgi:hypothetical protein
MLNTFLFVNTTLHEKIIKTGEAPLQGTAVWQSGIFINPRERYNTWSG